jgi:hypothetical protein
MEMLIRSCAVEGAQKTIRHPFGRRGYVFVGPMRARKPASRASTGSLMTSSTCDFDKADIGGRQVFVRFAARDKPDFTLGNALKTPDSVV